MLNMYGFPVFVPHLDHYRCCNNPLTIRCRPDGTPFCILHGTNVGERVVDSKIFEETDTGGKKDTEGKLRFDLIPPEVLEEYAKILTDGAKKYSERNWEKGLKLQEHHLGAALRHINKWQKGEDINKEIIWDKIKKVFITTENNHMSHALWHICAIVTQIARGRKDLDDRRSK